jgi:hypothetical protein
VLVGGGGGEVGGGEGGGGDIVRGGVNKMYGSSDRRWSNEVASSPTLTEVVEVMKRLNRSGSFIVEDSQVSSTPGTNLRMPIECLLNFLECDVLNKIIILYD